MKEINRALKKYLESKEQEADFKHQVGNSTLLVAVLNRFILDGLHTGYKKQLQLNPKDGDATLQLMQLHGEQRVLYKFAELFRAFGLDDHPLIKAAPHNYFLGGVLKGD